jgi:hypothetical protein
MDSSNAMQTAAVQKIDATSSAEAWFAQGERLGYDPKARAITVEGAPLNIFLRREGDLAHAVTFLPGYPDGSFALAKVLPHLPNTAKMPKLFCASLWTPLLTEHRKRRRGRGPFATR